MKKRFLFITCEEAKHICDKSQYGEASLWERLKLNIRLSWCKITRAYSRNNSILTDLIKANEVKVMPLETKKNLQKAFEKELANQK